MAKFYFNLREGAEIVSDDEGSELPDVGHARDLAVKSALAILASELEATGRLDLEGEVFVSDDAGAVVTTVRFADVVTITPDQG